MNKKLKIWIIVISILMAYNTYICVRVHITWYQFSHAFDKPKEESKDKPKNDTGYRRTSSYY